MYESTLESVRRSFSSFSQVNDCTSNGTISTKEYRLQILQGQTSARNSFHNDSSSSYRIQSSYMCNTEKENTCNHVLHLTMLGLKSTWTQPIPCFAVAQNEFHVLKCVCAAIQPIPFPRYCKNAESCAKELALHMEYEPLFSQESEDGDEKILEPSSNRIIVSPTQTLEWGIGDCFDLSTLLVSFLLGMGYDAYVVHGAAPKWIRMMDELTIEQYSSLSNTDTTNQVQAVQELTQWIDLTRNMKSLSRSTFAPVGEECSHPWNTFLLEEKIRFACTTDSAIDMDNSYSSNENSNDSNGKDYPGEHCWIFIRDDTRSRMSFLENDDDKDEDKSQRRSQFYFLEPSTGQRFELHDGCPYKEVYAMWNTKNYWILPPNTSSRSIKDSFMNFPEALWISLFPSPILKTDTAHDKPCSPPKVGQMDQPPLQWVQGLNLIAETKLSRCSTYPPKGQRTFMNSDYKVDLFAKGVHPQGLEKRVTTYLNSTQHGVQNIREYFWPDGRADNMQWRIRLPDQMAFHEKYFSNNAIGLEDWYEVLGHRRVIRFRPFSRIDGLLERDETYGVFICDTFENRVDGMTKREIHFIDDGSYQKGEQESMEFTSMDSGPLSRSVKSIT